MFKFFQKRKKEPEDLGEVLSRFNGLEKEMEKLSKSLEALSQKNRISFQKMGVVRFNPFAEIGGDQSFSIALLDGNDNGLVITSLYGREGNRVFAKPVKEGKSEYSLSQEEEEAIKRAKTS